MKPERRLFPVHELRVATNAAGKPMMAGHAAVFNVRSEIYPGFLEEVRPGTFAETITADDVRALFNHDANYVLGRSKIPGKPSTLRLSEDATGLAFEVDLPDTQVARDLAISLERGDVSQCSFSFTTIDDELKTEGEKTVRTLTKVRLYDVGPVTFPAYPETDVSMRSLASVAEECQKRMAPPPGVPLSVRQRQIDLARVA